MWLSAEMMRPSIVSSHAVPNKRSVVISDAGRPSIRFCDAVEDQAELGLDNLVQGIAAAVGPVPFDRGAGEVEDRAEHERQVEVLAEGAVANSTFQDREPDPLDLAQRLFDIGETRKAPERFAFMDDDRHDGRI